ncbi:zinc finger CCCH domain-containing protein 19 [Gastrolobium bilobum]|uniref:zinc finger CCCH domain-containing protein 19 n=1 Tax=Gastrolobium bilobum TaxID=150636 RepID=UPI002AB17D04|nr:zinc finger CCCH domain-containing protein 19 [Gastrolobium bilobum]
MAEEDRGKGKRKTCQEQEQVQEQEQEQEPEDWCFECKDGGQLVICDHENCGKVYHPDCVGKDDSVFGSVESWVCGRHYCSDCNKPPKFYCLGCPNAVCTKCVASSEFTVVRGVKGLCSDCLELVEIIEQNLDHDSEGNKLSLNDRETYEGLFKEYWEIIKVKEGLTGDDVFDAQPNYKKGKNFLLHRNFSEGEEEKQDDSMAWDSNEDYTSKHKLTKSKRSSSEEFVGWGSKPLISFLASIGKYENEPLTQWGVKSIIYEYIKEKNLHHPKYHWKFLPDEKLFPIFRKTVISKSQIYPLLEFHFAKKLYDSAGEKNDNQNNSTDKHLNDHTSCIKRRLSSLIGKPLLKKGDLFIKPSCFASINPNNINLIYLKQSLVLKLSKQLENFMDKVVGTFVRAKVDSNDYRERKSHHLLRVIGVVFDEMSNGILLQVSFMPKAIPISEVSDEDFTEQECEDLRQKVKAHLLKKITVVELQEKAKSLHEDIIKHRIATRLVYLQNQIDRANLKGRQREKIALLEEREQLVQPWKQEQLLRHEPSVSPELIEAKYEDSEEEKLET